MRRFSGCTSENKAKMALVLQGNMHRSGMGNDLVEQICFEKHADIILISEQYRTIHISDHGSGSGCVKSLAKVLL